MPIIAFLRTMLRSLRNREAFEVDLNEEIRFHIEQRASDLVRAQGLSPAQALRQARLEFGGQETVREECRRSFGLRWIDELRQDLSYGIRTLVRRPVFALVAITTLGVGIGGNSAMFSVVDTIILRTLPVRAAGELFVLHHDSRIGMSQRYSWPFVAKLSEVLAPAGRVAAMTRANSMRMGSDPNRGRATVQLVSGDWFDVIGVRPLAGRFIGLDDNRIEGAHPVAIVSAAFWQQQFGDARFETGREVRLNGYPLQIVGVAPATFRGVFLERPIDVWVPLMMQHQLGHKNNFSASNALPDQPWPSQDNVRWLDVIVRSSAPPGTMEAALNSGLQWAMFASASEETKRSARLRLEPFSHGFSSLRADFGSPIRALVATVVLVLLIVCANIGNLLLARASERRREIAVRLSLGAGRGRLIRQMLTESLLLAGCGIGVGLAFAYWAMGSLSRAATHVGATRLELELDVRVLAFTCAVGLFAAVLFGLLPAIRATRLDPALEQMSGSRTLHGGSRLRLAGALVAAQVTLSVVLVSGAALFLHSLRNLATFDPGFTADHMLLARLDIDASLQDRALAEYWRTLVERVNAIPGVQSSAIAVCALIADCTNSSSGFVIPGYIPQAGEQIRLQTEAISPGYFATVGMKLLSGREFSWQDGSNPQRIVIVNDALVRRYFGGVDPVGRVLSYPQQPDMEIVGVVNDARVNGLRTPPIPMIWRPAAQMTLMSDPTLHVRVDPAAPTPVASLRQTIAAMDGRVRLNGVTSVSEQVGLSLWREYLLAGATAAFASLALFLACFGLYGVMSHAVARRTPEFGIRLALGAHPRRVLWQAMRESLALVAIGLGLGIPLSLAAARLVHDLLFGISAGDPPSVAVASGILWASAMLAAYLPARRASRVDPAIALRHE